MELLTSPLTAHFILSIVIGTFFVYLVAQAVHLHHVSVWFHTLKTIVDYGIFLLSGFIGATYYGLQVEHFVHPNPEFHLTAALRAWILSWVALFLVNYFFFKCKKTHEIVAAGISGLLTTILFIVLLLPEIAAHPTIACWYLKCT